MKRSIVQEPKSPLHAQIREVVNRHDPAGLSPGGWAPADEYDPEVNRIVSLISSNPTVHELTNICWDVFVSMFSYGTRGKAHVATSTRWYRKMAEEIHARLNK
jgi:hypothetical protein